MLALLPARQFNLAIVLDSDATKMHERREHIRVSGGEIKEMARLAGIEPATLGFGGQRFLPRKPA